MIGRVTPYCSRHAYPAQYAKADDPIVVAKIREIIRQGGSYGYGRVTAMVNRTFDTGYNCKRIQRVMEINAWEPATTNPAWFVPVTGPAYSPQSNGMSEASINTLRRHYLDGADRSTATSVLDQVLSWISATHRSACRARLSRAREVPPISATRSNDERRRAKGRTVHS